MNLGSTSARACLSCKHGLSTIAAPPTLSAIIPTAFYRLSKPSISPYQSASLLSFLTGLVAKHSSTSGNPHGLLAGGASRHMSHSSFLARRARGVYSKFHLGANYTGSWTTTPRRRPRARQAKARMWLLLIQEPRQYERRQPLGQQCSSRIARIREHLLLFVSVPGTGYSAAAWLSQLHLLARKMGSHTRVCACHSADSTICAIRNFAVARDHTQSDDTLCDLEILRCLSSSHAATRSAPTSGRPGLGVHRRGFCSCAATHKNSVMI